MSEHEDERAIERLRASDPASAAEPDRDRIDRLTAERRGDELAGRRDRHRWAVAAAVAGALVVGGAGYSVGSATAPTDEPPAEPVAATEQMSQRGDTPEAMADIGMAHDGSRTVFHAAGLSTDSGTAAAWAFDAPAALDEQTAGHVAAVFGISGDPEESDGGWRAGPQDGSGPTVQLSGDGIVSLYFQDPELYESLDGGDAGEVEPLPMPMPEGLSEVEQQELADRAAAADMAAEPVEPSDAVEPTDAVEPGEPGPDTPVEYSTAHPAQPAPPADPTATADVGDAGDEAAALQRALSELGVDAAEVEVETEPFWSGEGIVWVTAHQVIDGERTGHQWSAVVSGERIYELSGPIAPLTSLGEYDVVSPAEAVERLGDPRFGAESWHDLLRPATEEPVEGWSWGDPPGPPPEPGSAIAWPVTDVEIVTAELTVTQHDSRDGAALLVPAYELSDSEGRSWRVLALAEDELAF